MQTHDPAAAALAGTAPVNDIAHWRNEIFSWLIPVMLVLGIPTAIPSVIIAVEQGMWGMVAMEFVTIAWVAVLWRSKRIPYRWRVFNILALMYVFGIVLIRSFGPVAQLYLAATPVLAAVLLGTRPALAWLAASGLATLALAHFGELHFGGDVPGKVQHSAMVITLNYLFIASILTLSCGILLHRLVRSMDDLRRIALSLRQGKDKLDTANAELSLTATALARLNEMVLIAEVGAGAGQAINFVNDAFLRRTGHARDEVLGASLDTLLGTGSLQAAIERGEAADTELLSHTRNGEPYWMELELVPFADAGGNNTHWVAVGRDITERKKAEAEIHRLAFFDPLTGLPNRRLLTDRLEKTLAGAQREHTFAAVLFIDLDHFKYVNDARGHATGDALLRHAGARLAGLVRAADTVARIGGDEFVVLLTGLGGQYDAAVDAALTAGEKIRAALSDSVTIAGKVYDFTASVGVTLLPKAGQTVDDLLREADTAMYRAKASGRNAVTFYESAMQAEVEQRLTLQRDLAGALEAGQLAMHFQVQVDQDRAPVGAELLMRWTRADGTNVPPDVFIPTAEESGLIVQLGDWALREACQALLRMRRAGHAMPLSVNVSPSQFRQAGFVDSVRAALADTGAPASELIFEVTEGLLIVDLDDTIARMRELAALGIRFSIDDFGTGYSSLRYLKRMPLYELKIDRSFIRDTPHDPNGTAIVQSVLAMARHLGLRVVAEGVETPAQAAFLNAHGCPGQQGWLYARPLPLDALLAHLDAVAEPRMAPAA